MEAICLPCRWMWSRVRSKDFPPGERGGNARSLGERLFSDSIRQCRGRRECPCKATLGVSVTFKAQIWHHIRIRTSSLVSGIYFKPQ